ncbi:MAG: LD-carboxypeptidase [Gammaproteobacteria bacterium]|nr:LD-carboxypeptidase [Gammaproteobacteria bacterium]
MSASIYVYSPSGAVVDKKSFRLAVKNAQKLGFQVQWDDSCLVRFQRFAGNDETRLAAVHRACEVDSQVVMVSRGGYGISRLLRHIPYQKMAKSIESGNYWLGFSDFTALQIALYVETSRVTWHGQAFIDTFGRTNLDEITRSFFQDVVATRKLHWVVWDIPKKEGSLYRHIQVQDAILWGGNLTMIASLLGTPWCPTKMPRGIMFIEEVNETPYRIERLMTQLLYSGVFDNQNAILLGAFSDFQTSPLDRGYALDTVVAWLRGQLKIPVITQLPIGHVPTKAILPFGKKARLEVLAHEARIDWG